jgi:hypothetical protein
MRRNHLISDRAWEKTGGWTCGERLRVLWYRLRLTVHEMNDATRRLAELQAAAPGLAGRQRPDDTASGNLRGGGVQGHSSRRVQPSPVRRYCRRMWRRSGSPCQNSTSSAVST